MKFAHIVSVFCIGFCISACSGKTIGDDGGDDAGSTSSGDVGGVSKSKKLSQLTPDEMGALCDYGTDEIYGGYNLSVPCGSGVSVPSHKNRQACISDTQASLPTSCSATVGDYQRCVDAIANDPCKYATTIQSDACDRFSSCVSL